MNYKHGLKNKIKECLLCGKKFIAKKDCLTRNQKYCSKQCFSKNQKGKKATEKQLKELKRGWGWNKGLKGIGGWKWKKESRKKLSKAKTGIKLSENHIKALSRAKKGKPIKHFIENKKIISEKISKALTGKPNFKIRGINHWNWQNGKTELNWRIRNSLKYKNWRRENFKRDNYICQECGKRGGRINVDHKKKFAQILFENNITSLEEALNCEELWNLKNGRTLCRKCHLKTDTWGGGQFYNKLQM